MSKIKPGGNCAENTTVTRNELYQAILRVGGQSLKTTLERPDDKITRVEAAVLIAATVPGLNTGFAGKLMPPFTDIDSLTQVEKEAVQYVYNTGLMLGVSATEFAPRQLLVCSTAEEIVTRIEGRVQGA
jgi:hypothetical protein